MQLKYHEFSRYDIEFRGWYIQWHNEGERYKWGTDVAREFGFGQYWDMLYYLQKTYGGTPLNGNLYFDTQEEAQEMLEWFEARILLQKMSEKIS